MAERSIPPELLDRLERDRQLIEQELPELQQRGARMEKAAAEDTLSGHLRSAIHQSNRPLRDLAAESGITSTQLCDFLEGQKPLPSDVLDRWAEAVGVTVLPTR